MQIKMNEIDVTHLLLNYKRSGSMTRIVGSAPTQILKLTLDNYDNVFEYEIVKSAVFTIKPTDTSNTYFFKVYEMPESWDGSIELTLYDVLYCFDIVYDTKLVYPVTIEEQLKEMQELTNIEIDYTYVPDEILQRTTNQYDTTVTIRSYLMWIAELCACNVLASTDKYNRVCFYPFNTIPKIEFEDVFNYKKGNPYKITKVEFNDGVRIMSEGNEDGNIYYLSSDNIYVTKQEHIAYVSKQLIGLSVNSATDIETEYITDVELSSLLKCIDFNFIVLEFEEIYVGGKTPDYKFSGELTTENQEQIGIKINNATKIRRLQVITNEQDLSLKILAQQQEELENKSSEFEVSIDGITSKVNNTFEKVEEVSDKFDNLQVVGRNLLLKCNDVESWEQTNLYYAPQYLEKADEIFIGNEVLKTSTQWQGIEFQFKNHIIDRNLVNVGDSLYFSLYAKTDDVNKDVQISPCHRQKNDDSVPHSHLIHDDYNDLCNVTEEWERYIIRIDVTEEVLNQDTYITTLGYELVTELTTDCYIYFSSPKLEKSTVTEWSVAPEDISNRIDNVEADVGQAKESADNAQERIVITESIIQQLTESISMLIRDENGMSLMEQTENGWSFSMASTNNAVNSLSTSLGELQEQMGSTENAVDILKDAVGNMTDVSQYVRITTEEDKPCIELGTGNSDFRLLITNTDIRFMEGGNIPAYISNQALHIKKAVIENELQQGNWVWGIRSNGNYGLMWKEDE